MNIATTLKIYIEENNGDLDKAITMIIQDGFDACGIVVEKPIEEYLAITDKLLQSGLKFCVHANMSDTNIASMNEGIRKESVKQVKDAIILAKELDSVVCFHPGKFRNQFHVNAAYKNMELSLIEIISFAKQNNIVICLENMEPGDKQLCVTPIQVKTGVAKFNDLMLCLDAAHVAMFEHNILGFMDNFNGRIKHFHISGYNGKNSHVEVNLRDSLVDFSDFIKAIKGFDGILRIENRTRQDNLVSLEFIKGALKDD